MRFRHLAYPAALVCLATLTSASLAATISFTAGEGYADGNLDTQQTWVAQSQWQVDSSGSGSVSTSVGDFIRAQYLGDTSTNDVGSMVEVSVTFTLEGDFGLRSDRDPPQTVPTANWQRGVFHVGLSNNPGSQAPNQRFGSGLSLDADNSSLALWVDGNPTDAAILGPASNYDGHTWVLTAKYTKTSDTEYTADVSIDSLDDAAGPFSVTKTNLTADVAAMTDVPVVMQGLRVGAPSANNHYDGINVSEFSVVNTPGVPEPTALSLIGLALAGLSLKRR